ncbi:MAG: hypothetical protein KC609_16430 [Myxococcales bacterium]|nr:hypothetical protein [Myxococcales bacterium]
MKRSLILMLALLIVGWTQVARAGVDELKKLYAKSRVQYFQLELSESEKTLDKAIAMIKSESLSGAFVARVYILRGVVAFINKKDKDAAKNWMVQGLKLDRKAKIDSDIITPDLETLFQEAVKSLPKVHKKIPFKLSHTPPTRATPGKSLSLVVTALGEPTFRVLVYYRNAELPIFTKIEMLPGSDNRYVATVPKDLLVGDYLYYYFEIQHDTQGVVARAGTESRPYKIRLDGKVITGPGTKRKKGIDDKIVNISLSIGTGGGYIARNKSVRKIGDENITVNPGFAFTPLHILTEIGFMIGTAWEIALFYRLQVIELAHAGGVKAKWYVKDNRPLRVYLAVGVGGGQVRHTVNLDPAVPNFVDTTKSGLGQAGLGAGLIYNFTPMVGILFEVYNAYYFPQFAAQIDVQAGVQLSF